MERLLTVNFEKTRNQSIELLKNGFSFTTYVYKATGCLFEKEMKIFEIALVLWLRGVLWNLGFISQFHSHIFT